MPPRAPEFPGAGAKREAIKPATAGVDREAILRRFAAVGVRVQGIVHERLPEAVRLAAGLDLFGVELRGDVFACLQRPVAHALVQIDDQSRLVSEGDDLAPDLTVLHIEVDRVLFRYRGIDAAVPLGAR